MTKPVLTYAQASFAVEVAKFFSHFWVSELDTREMNAFARFVGLGEDQIREISPKDEHKLAVYTAPKFVGDDIVHRTGSGRTTLRCTPDGQVTVVITRPSRTEQDEDGSPKGIEVLRFEGNLFTASMSITDHSGSNVLVQHGLDVRTDHREALMDAVSIFTSARRKLIDFMNFPYTIEGQGEIVEVVEGVEIMDAFPSAVCTTLVFKKGGLYFGFFQEKSQFFWLDNNMVEMHLSNEAQHTCCAVDEESLRNRMHYEWC